MGNRLLSVRHYPVFLNLAAQPCVVVGGGPVAERKVESLVECGARVTVISPEVTSGLAALADTHEVVHHPRPYRRGDLAGAVLAYAATDDEALHAEIAAEASEARVPLNVVDRPQLCSFIVPSVLTRGPVSVAVSTGGESPILARRLREELERSVGAEWGIAATLLGRLRRAASCADADRDTRARLFTALVDSPLLAALRDGDVPSVDAILDALVGQGTTLRALGLSLSPASPDGTDAP